MRFANRVVVVTGGAQGIGAGCVEVFADEGARVVIVDRNFSQAIKLAERYPARALAIEADVMHPAEVEKAIEKAYSWGGRIDCLVNNAGIHPPDTPIEQMPPMQALHVMQVNFISTYAGAYYALRYLRETKGTIVNISSMTALLGQKNSTAYAASKGAQLAFTKSLALECAADGIRVNAILPSNVDTPLMSQWAQSLSDPEAALARIAALQPLGRMATPQEIGRVCLFLATDDSSFMTGQGLEVDGGAALDY
jgi:NAD(P)-dependent dehydrogenase (short-subunit alcohol dehydrogenase family)